MVTSRVGGRPVSIRGSGLLQMQSSEAGRIAQMGAERIMRSRISPETLHKVVEFHGHLCPGLTHGIRAAEIALRELGPAAQDEEIVAVVETDSCAVDAIQVLVGCTFGKGNLVHLDYGKHAFTFARRSDGLALRVVGKPRPPRPEDPEVEALRQRVRCGEASAEGLEAVEALWRERSLAVLDVEEDELYDLQTLEGYVLPERASVCRSVRCDACGEMAMASRMRLLDGMSLCVPCYERAAGPAIAMRAIGVVNSDLKPKLSPPRAKSPRSVIRVHSEYADGLLGLSPGDQVEVLYCFDRSPLGKVPLRQHPRGDRSAPVRGVFGLRSPRRPNPIGLSTVRVLQVENNLLVVSGLDAWDGTPMLDIKPSV